ncbi:hypothetical protein ACFL54_03145 [Planctomycetota bacterium]
MGKAAKIIILMILAMAFVLVPVVLMHNRFQRGASYGPLSTYRADRYGIKALFLLLNRLDYPVYRHKIPVTHQAAPTGTMIIAGPGLMSLQHAFKGAMEGGEGFTIQEEEVKGILDWVEKGNQLWVVSPYRTAFHEELGVSVRYNLAEIISDVNSLGEFMGLVEDLNESNLKDDSDTESTFERLFDHLSLPKKQVPVHELMQDPELEKIQVFAGPYLAGDNEEIFPLAGNDSYPVVAEIPCGQGHVVFIADFFSISNAGIGKADNVMFLAKMMAHYHPEGGVVLFDEYHHGVKNDQGIVALMKKYALHFLLLQAAVLLGVSFWRYFPRDGEAIEEEIEHVRNTGSYVASAASLYESVLPPAVVMKKLFKEFWRSEMRRLHMPARSKAENVLAVLKERQPKRASALRKILSIYKTSGVNTRITTRSMVNMVARLNNYEKGKVGHDES